MKYRKKLVEVEAHCFTYENMELKEVPPMWVVQAIDSGKIYRHHHKIYIRTLEGDMRVKEGDYIVKGVKDELYACEPNIFKLTYEAV
jgi:hypothetical protein